MKKDILVVGGAGYIGSHTCLRLAEKGFNPIVVDNLSTGHKQSIQWGPFYQTDIFDAAGLEKVFMAHNIQGIFHFAASAYVGESVENPLKYYHNNVAGTISLLAAVKKFGIQKFVFSSTCATYGVPSSTPIDEGFPQNPVNPYGDSKLMVERILKETTRAYGIQTAALRYFNAAGSDPELRIGESHDPETHLIPLAIAASDNGKELTLFGQDYPTTDGTCVRDYIHVNDLADAHILAFEKMNTEKSNEMRAYNLGTGSGVSNLEIINTTEKVTGRKVRYRLGARRPGDPPALVASGEKARRELGWEPKVSDINTIIANAESWHQKVHQK